MENEQETITAKEIQELLNISHQAFSRKTWMPEVLYRNKNKMRIYDKQKVMNAIKEQYGDFDKKCVIKSDRFREERERMVKMFNSLITTGLVYENFKLVPNRGDCMLALKAKQNSLRPWVYERRREVLKCEWSVK